MDLKKIYTNYENKKIEMRMAFIKTICWAHFGAVDNIEVSFFLLSKRSKY